MKRQRTANNLIGVLICMATTLLFVLGVEAFLRYSSHPPYQWERRLIFFTEGSVFENKNWGGFVYVQNGRIHSQTYYITDPSVPKLKKEFEYDIWTNSDGLVQLDDVVPLKPSILFLGDSFTEGQGALPWFYDFQRHWPKNGTYQIINGGLLGTGVEAWERLYQDISSTANIAKLVVIFISSDWSRPVWQFSEQALRCLNSASRCTGANSFFGLSENADEAQAEIIRIAKARVDQNTAVKNKQNFFKTSLIYNQLLKPAYHLWRPENQLQFEKSKEAALRLVIKLGRKNVLFIQIPQKDELQSGSNHLGKEAARFINQNGLLFVDGFEKCPLAISDYHEHDGHPNVNGYVKIQKCIDENVRKIFAVDH